ncbi:hypothetical protein QTP70_010635 [Hemibagrus guttatus]|uniref:Alkylated DNA repair protein AlkB homologue 8 N-terminal domain-containing protein n=1 Tax=Hemibagrus guttatus TaxID=175788 RepID=A0AAE0PVF8_9TELE|nr:hypothetical protein QTP70_010635 [Hemibagrus guttatus]
MHSSNHIIKFADDTTVVGLISKNDKSAYREEVQRLTAWCKANNLSLNVEKMKEMVVEHRDFTWSLNTSSITKKAQQHLYFLRRLRKAHLPPLILTTFYRGTIESVLSSCITAWFGNCTVSDSKTLQWIVRTAEKIIGVSLPSIMNIYSTSCIHKANSNVGCTLEKKEGFWSELDEVMESITTGERVVIGADFNGHGEGNTGDEEVMGMFGVKERNLEGQIIVYFAKRMDMAVVNTYFQKREEHRVTYKIGGRNTQIDYTLLY